MCLNLMTMVMDAVTMDNESLISVIEVCSASTDPGSRVLSGHK